MTERSHGEEEETSSHLALAEALGARLADKHAGLFAVRSLPK
jgi:hypothetical protein